MTIEEIKATILYFFLVFFFFVFFEMNSANKWMEQKSQPNFNVSHTHTYIYIHQYTPVTESIYYTHRNL